MALRERIPLLVSSFSAALLLFLIGFACSFFQWWPYSLLATAFEQSTGLVDSSREHAHLRPARYAETGLIQGPTVATSPGITLVSSYWHDDGGVAGVRLFDLEGNVLGHYRTAPLELWEESPHDDCATPTFHLEHNYVHGTHLFENGDLLFNVEYLGLVRMRPDGSVVWRLDRRTHHSVTRTERGDFWVCGAKCIGDNEEALLRFRGTLTPLTEDLAMRVSADGEVLQEVSILEALRDSPYWPRVFQKHAPEAARYDVLHMNDVEELSTEMAAAYPMFEAGDLLISLRDIDAVLVLDPDTKAIRWFEDSKTVMQHDPDFLGDGWISIYDNNPDGAEGLFRGGTRILGIRPETGETRVLYERPAPPDHFFSELAGKAQKLPHGGWILCEATGGRVLEVDAGRQVLWEWRKDREPDGQSVAEIYAGDRYPFDPETVRGWFSGR
ncbi:MAG: arylsulfotransferase family protein [Planctomycetota bacterium]